MPADESEPNDAGGDDGGPADERARRAVRDGEPLDLGSAGPFGHPWRTASFGPTALRLSRPGETAAVPYADVAGVDTVRVRPDEHGPERVAVDLVALGGYIVVAGGLGVLRRATGRDVSPPARATRYANDVVGFEEVTRVRIRTADRTYDLYADGETAAAIEAELRERVRNA